jgi:hypothetical protein
MDNPDSPRQLAGCYEVRQVLGQGGMGLVYRAYEKLAQDGVKRKTEAHRLMTGGQDLCAMQKPAEGIKLLREAYELDENYVLFQMDEIISIASW